MSIESMMPSSHLILCCPLLLLPPIPPSIRVFSNESTLHMMRWAKSWSFSFSISPSNEHPGFVSFRMDWLDLLAIQGTLKSLLQHHSSKASILRHSAFFYSPTFPSIHDYKNHSFDQTDLCQQRNVALAKSIIMSRNYHFFFLMRTFNIISLSNLQVYNMVLLNIISKLYT